MADKRYLGRFDDQLHKSPGPHYLKQPALANLVAECLPCRDQRLYRLDAFSIMSNRVHVEFRPLQEGGREYGTPKYYLLEEIMQSLKRHSARECNRLLDRQGTFW